MTPTCGQIVLGFGILGGTEWFVIAIAAAACGLAEWIEVVSGLAMHWTTNHVSTY